MKYLYYLLAFLSFVVLLATLNILCPNILGVGLGDFIIRVFAFCKISDYLCKKFNI